MNENQTPQAQTQEVSAETLAGATKRAVVTLPQTAFKKRLERAAERGTRETLTQLPQVLKAQYGLDLEEIKALVAEKKAAQAQQRAPTTQEVRQENPREPGETKPDYEARVKELLEAQRAEFGRILEEYWDAVVDEHRRSEPADKFSWFGSMAQERLAVVGKQVEMAFQREEKSGAIAYAYLMKDLGLSKTQERRVRELIMEFTEKGGDSLPKAEKDRFFAGILAMLTPEQAEKLIKKIQGNK